MDLRGRSYHCVKDPILCDIKELFSYCVFSTGFIFEIIPENYCLKQGSANYGS